MRPTFIMRRRWTIIACALVAAAAFALSVEDGHWWTIAEVSIGPFGAHHCFSGECRATGLAWIGASNLWLRSALATGIAGLMATGLLVVIAGCTAARRVADTLAKTTIVALATAAVCAGYFVFAFPDLGAGQAALGRGVFLYLGAIPLGLAAAVLVLRAGREM